MLPEYDVVSHVLNSQNKARHCLCYLCCQFLKKNLGHQHTEAVKTIMQYLKGSNKQKILYGGQNKLLVEKYFNSN